MHAKRTPHRTRRRWHPGVLVSLAGLALLAAAIGLTVGIRHRAAEPQVTRTTWIWHYTPGIAHEIIPTWREMLETLPEDGRVLIAVRSPRDAASVCRELGSQWSEDERITYVNVRATLSTWARDRYIAVEGHGKRRVLHPSIGVVSGRARGDVFVALEVAKQDTNLLPVELQHNIEGGDVIQTAECVLIGAETVRLCCRKAKIQERAFLDQMREAFGRRPIVVHDGQGRVPWNHLDMYLTVLDDHTLVLGDPRLALAAWPKDVYSTSQLETKVGRFQKRTQEGLVPVYEGIAQNLRGLGFTVHRIPILHGNPERDDRSEAAVVSWNNVLLDGREGRRAVWLPRYGIASLDAAAQRVWSDLGYQVHAIDTSGAICLRGGLRCLTNVVDTVELDSSRAPFLPPPCGQL